MNSLDKMEDYDRLVEGNKSLHREVAMLRDVLIRTAMDLKNSDNYDEALLDAAINNTQATAEAYEREIVDNYITKLRNLPKIGLSERQFGELHAANKGKEIV